MGLLESRQNLYLLDKEMPMLQPLEACSQGGHVTLNAICLVLSRLQALLVVAGAFGLLSTQASVIDSWE